MLISVSGVPQATSFMHELFFKVGVPVFILFVKLDILVLGHAMYSHYSLGIIGAHILHCGDGSWYHLFQVMKLVHVLLL